MHAASTQTSLIAFVITRSTDCELALHLSTMVFSDEVSMLGGAAEQDGR